MSRSSPCHGVRHVAKLLNDFVSQYQRFPSSFESTKHDPKQFCVGGPSKGPRRAMSASQSGYDGAMSASTCKSVPLALFLVSPQGSFTLQTDTGTGYSFVLKHSQRYNLLCLVNVSASFVSALAVIRWFDANVLPGKTSLELYSFPKQC